MPDIRIHRDHQLGLARARKVAWQWAEEAESKFDMACTVIEGETSDTIEFTRSGVNGRLIVAPDHFDLDAKLGFLLGAFSRTIETQIEQALDKLLAKSQASAGVTAAAPRKAAARTADKSVANTATNASTKSATKTAGKTAGKPAPKK